MAIQDGEKDLDFRNLAIKVPRHALAGNGLLINPEVILRHRRRLDPPCLRVFHLPSPTTLVPVLCTARQGITRFNAPF